MLTLATEKNLEPLLCLIRQYHVFEAIELTDAMRKQALIPLLAESEFGRIWLISHQDTWIGYIAVCFGYSIELMGRDAFIDEFFIVESHRRRGIGRSVLTRVIEQMKPLGIQALHLEVARDNECAKKLYQAIGFNARDKYHLMTRKI